MNVPGAALSEKHDGGSQSEEAERSEIERTGESFAHLNEKAILRKMDIRLIPMLALLYLLSFLDRGNIGNAKIEGLQEDLGLTDDQYNWCLTAFFFTYAAFEVPSNLMLKKIRPSIWLPAIMVAWGVVMTLMGIVHNFTGLLTARIFLGVTEAGLFPGVAYYLTNWYKREEMQLRQAMFFSAASIAGAFSGLLAFAIGKMDGVGGLHGWQWIFILEARGTITLWWPRPMISSGNMSDRRFWIGRFGSTSLSTGGFTAQLMTVPIYITAAILAVIVAYFSDRVGRRSPFIIVPLLIMVVGFSMCIASGNPRVVYGGVFIAACAIYPAFPGVIAWLSNNLAGSLKRSVGMAVQIGVGNLGGAMASNFYRAKDAPRYRLGHGLELGFIGAGIVASLILLVGYSSANKKRVKKIEDGDLGRYTQEELSEKGDKAITFRYVY
ncbi:Putative Permease of the major facilitator superfamily [Podospora comata]|uniref:Permease of the major facilitator superfamily n=1 Tax=Podospora comata TaxID=48703 RepID=A0ABY6S7Y6_PODCO|nr:Putative Permease of the major facilitator superfamily [Podospora comata]